MVTSISWLPIAGACCSNILAAMYYCLLNNNDLQFTNFPYRRITSKLRASSPTIRTFPFLKYSLTFKLRYSHSNHRSSSWRVKIKLNIGCLHGHACIFLFLVFIVYGRDCSKIRIKIHRNIITRFTPNCFPLKQTS